MPLPPKRQGWSVAFNGEENNKDINKNKVFYDSISKKSFRNTEEKEATDERPSGSGTASSLRVQFGAMCDRQSPSKQLYT